MKRFYRILAIAAVASVSAVADASIFAFKVNGPGVSADLLMTYEPNANTGVLPGTSPNPVDPIGSFIITDISGTYSNANLNIANAAVTGLVPVNYASPDPQNRNAPHSFSRLLIKNGVQSDVPGAPPAPGLSYDNLSTRTALRKLPPTIRSRAACSTSTASSSPSPTGTRSISGATGCSRVLG